MSVAAAIYEGSRPADPKRPEAGSRLEVAQAAQRQASRFGIDLKDPIVAAMGKVEPRMGFYFAAKKELNTDANDAGVIPWTALKIYADTYGLDVDQFEEFVRIIRAMEAGISGVVEREKKAKDAGKKLSDTKEKRGLAEAQKD